MTHSSVKTSRKLETQAKMTKLTLCVVLLISLAFLTWAGAGIREAVAVKGNVASPANEDEDENDPIPIETLQQVCENEHGGHLNKQLIVANYNNLVEVFKPNKRLQQLLTDALDSFEKDLGTKRLSRTELLKTHTNRLCGVLESMSEVVALSEQQEPHYGHDTD